MSNVEEFARTTREFSEWCLSRPGQAQAEARIALSFLLRLYAHALALQFPENMNDELEGERADDATWRRVFERAGALPFNYYWEVYHSHTVPPEEPVVADLADDLADIYRDLSEGLSLHGGGHVAEAEWTFLFSFQSHWGRHASSAIKALHCWFEDTGNW